MSPGWRRGVLTGAAVLVVAIVVAAVVILRGESGPPAADGAAQPSAGDVATRFLSAFAGGDTTLAGSLTDNPTAAAAALAATRTELGATAVTAGLNQVGSGADRVTGRFTVGWTLARQRTWTYDNEIELVRSGDGWLVRWKPALIHPKLDEGRRLVVRGTDGQPAAVDRDGAPLLVWQGTSLLPAGNKAPTLLTNSLARTVQDQGGQRWGIAVVDSGGTVVETVFGADPSAEAAPASTIGAAIQAKAQAAVDSVERSAVLVALQPSTGELLAVAQNNAAGIEPKAFTGLYAPGSVFKIATATAALSNGISADAVLQCPSEIRIGQRTLPNDGRFSLPPSPLHTAFAHSCNTTFASVAAGLPPDALVEAANKLGLGADFSVPGVDTELGTVEQPRGQAEAVEASIGQGRVLASPLGLAVMVATVASGKAVTPKLWRSAQTTVNTGYQPPAPSVLGPLRAMMREVVTAGTAKSLGSNGAVHGKTGTAEVGDAAKANGWFAGYRGDVAFAVLVEGGNASAPALAVAGKFLAGG
ncbi:penicillin-binding transpeptidase domain-containing protein [Amycolatopsis suaedae]|uniref:Penicillin-binding protein n=1 Tax=Amycolatopsis suaedae TaxID=2510978 RepID=A0A4Q7J7P2_9PSEU|nr:penicillin-binding transpeptidase domain-containing protein [Amycolatopsis suaedae]RZQ63209.1 penicillin-binding protein [Amycolatopsis suaedae]